jgi:hypothetical protein
MLSSCVFKKVRQSEITSALEELGERLRENSGYWEQIE